MTLEKEYIPDTMDEIILALQESNRYNHLSDEYQIQIIEFLLDLKHKTKELLLKEKEEDKKKK